MPYPFLQFNAEFITVAFSVYEPSEIKTGYILNTSGNETVYPTGAYSLCPIEENCNVIFENFPSNFLVKQFFDSSKQKTGPTFSINNGTIIWEDIPSNAAFIGFNVKVGSQDVINTCNCFVQRKYLIKDTPEIGIPSIVPVAVGTQANIYMENIISKPVNEKTEIYLREGPVITTTKSNPYEFKTRRTERAIQYMPTVSNQSVQVTAQIRNGYYNVLKEKQFQFLSVPNNNGSGFTKNIILCGDSQIDTTYDNAKTSFAPFLKRMFLQSGTVTMNFIGTQNLTETVYYGSNAAQNVAVTCATEGYGGVQSNYFTGSSGPFWNASTSKIDFHNYMTQRGFTGQNIDYIVFIAGVNDYNNHVATNTIISRFITFINLVLAEYPNCKIIIGLPTMGMNFWSMDVRRKWNIQFYAALVNEFENVTYVNKIFLAAAGLWTDNIYGSRQLVSKMEPYQRIIEAKNLLINKYIQGGMTQPNATKLVEEDWGFKVEESIVRRWMDEYPGTTDIVHSSWISAMQQADCYYSMLRYVLSI